jgi:hypothetical protein
VSGDAAVRGRGGCRSGPGRRGRQRCPTAHKFGRNSRVCSRAPNSWRSDDQVRSTPQACIIAYRTRGLAAHSRISPNHDARSAQFGGPPVPRGRRATGHRRVCVSEEASKPTHSGKSVSAETSRRLTYDASVVEVSRSPGGEILNFGRRTRTIPPALRRALRGASHHVLGQRGRDEPHQPPPPLQAPSPHRARGRLDAGAHPRRAPGLPESARAGSNRLPRHSDHARAAAVNGATAARRARVDTDEGPRPGSGARSRGEWGMPRTQGPPLQRVSGGDGRAQKRSSSVLAWLERNPRTRPSQGRVIRWTGRRSVKSRRPQREGRTKGASRNRPMVVVRRNPMCASHPCERPPYSAGGRPKRRFRTGPPASR